jgi:nucleotide-binding universal stress UspA family protein
MPMVVGETPIRARANSRSVFGRVLVGIDSSDASLEAARQAAVLTENDGTLTLLGVYLPPPVTEFERAYMPDPDEERRKSEAAVAAAVKAIGSLIMPGTRVACGFPWHELIEELDARHSTLVAVGSHGQGRVEGILAASTTSELVHKAPCSVLVVRPAGRLFPERIVVGLDGSPESAQAYGAAHRLSSRFGSELRPVVALDGRNVDLAEVELLAHDHEELPGDPVEALLAASTDADLLVVGSRGLRGVRSLGSVSERVAHRAPCSTLVVRAANDAP